MENKDRDSNRRKFLRLSALAGIAGFLVGRVTENLSIPSVRADDGQPLLIGAQNTGSSETCLFSDVQHPLPDEGSVLLAINTATAGNSTGLTGVSNSVDYGAGVVGVNNATSGIGKGVTGYSNAPNGGGVAGHATAQSGMCTGTSGICDSPEGIGVGGTASATSGWCRGVEGLTDSPEGIGVRGYARDAAGLATGVRGESSSEIGVNARSDTGKALKVEGVASFSTAGAGLIPARSSSVDIADTRVTDSSHVTITFTDNPGKSASVQWIAREPGVGFTVHLTGRVAGNTSFTYLIVEPS